jgi:hypothetical protein
MATNLFQQQLNPQVICLVGSTAHERGTMGTSGMKDERFSPKKYWLFLSAVFLAAQSAIIFEYSLLGKPWSATSSSRSYDVQTVARKVSFPTQGMY